MLTFHERNIKYHVTRVSLEREKQKWDTTTSFKEDNYDFDHFSILITGKGEILIFLTDS